MKIFSWCRFSFLILLTFIVSSCSYSKFEVSPSPFIPKVATSYPVAGDDHLALLSSHYKVSEVCQHHKDGEALGILDWTFGESLSNLRKFFACAKVGVIRVHLINNTCIRNKSCGKYEIGYGYTLDSFNNAILNKDAKIKNFVQSRTQVYKTWRTTEQPYQDIAISPILEGNETDAAYEILADWVKEVWPEVQLANNKMDNNGKSYRGAWIECHGKSLPSNCDIISTDGQEIMDIDSVKYIKQNSGKKIKFRWSRVNNCRDQGPLLDPRKRTNCATGREAEQQVHVTDIIGNAPTRTFSCSTKPFDKNDIWKPLSEDKGTNDERANLPVIIPSDLPDGTVTLTTRSGQIAGTLGYYGHFTDGRPRSYSGYPGGSKITGYEFQKAAERISGSSYVWAKRGSKCVGPFIPGRRQGDFR